MVAQDEFELLRAFVRVLIDRTSFANTIRSMRRVIRLGDQIRNNPVRVNFGTQGGDGGSGAGGTPGPADESRVQRIRGLIEDTVLDSREVTTRIRESTTALSEQRRLRQRIVDLMQDEQLSENQVRTARRAIIGIETRINTILRQQERDRERLRRQQERATDAGARHLSQLRQQLSVLTQQTAERAQQAAQGVRDASVGGATGVFQNPLSLEGVADGLRAITSNAADAFRTVLQLGGGLRSATIAGVAVGTVSGGVALLSRTLRSAYNQALALSRALGQAFGRAALQSVRALLLPVTSLLQRLRDIAAFLPLIAAGFAGLAARSIGRLTASFETIRGLFDVTFGASANRELQGIIATIERFGLPLESTAIAFGRISRASQNADIALSDVRRLFEATGQAAIQYGLEQERVTGAYLAFEQIISKGRVTTEELRRQLGDRLPDAVGTLARGLGVTTAELDKLLKTGQISAQQFVEAFGRQLQIETASVADQLEGSFRLALGRIRTQLTLLGATIGDQIRRPIAEAISRIAQLVSRIRTSDIGRTVFESIGRVAERVNLFFLRIQRFLDTGASTLFDDTLRGVRELARLIGTVNIAATGLAVEGVRRLTNALSPLFERTTTAINRIFDLDFTSLDAFVASVERFADNLSSRFNLVVDSIESFGIPLRAITTAIADTARTFIQSIVSFGQSEDGRNAIRGVGDALESFIAAFREYGQTIIQNLPLLLELARRRLELAASLLRLRAALLPLFTRLANVVSALVTPVAEAATGLATLTASAQRMFGVLGPGLGLLSFRLTALDAIFSRIRNRGVPGAPGDQRDAERRQQAADDQRRRNERAIERAISQLFTRSQRLTAFLRQNFLDLFRRNREAVEETTQAAREDSRVRFDQDADVFQQIQEAIEFGSQDIARQGLTEQKTTNRLLTGIVGFLNSLPEDLQDAIRNSDAANEARRLGFGA